MQTSVHMSVNSLIVELSSSGHACMSYLKEDTLITVRTVNHAWLEAPITSHTNCIPDQRQLHGPGHGAFHSSNQRKHSTWTCGDSRTATCASACMAMVFSLYIVLMHAACTYYYYNLHHACICTWQCIHMHVQYRCMVAPQAIASASMVANYNCMCGAWYNIIPKIML